MSHMSDFSRFWAGQVVSSLGSSFTSFAIPLLVFVLTGSALDLGLATAATFLPYPLLGLVVGALADRLDRKRLMIAADLMRASTIASVALLASVDSLSMWWIVSCAFVASTFTIAFESAAAAAVPSLVDRGELVRANGRVHAGDAAAQVVGPLLAGAVVLIAPVEVVLFADSATFLISAVSLALVRTSFGGGRNSDSQGRIFAEVKAGLAFTLGRPELSSSSSRLWSSMRAPGR